MQRNSRLKRELQMLSTEPPPGVSCWQLEEKVEELQAQIVGGANTPYDGGLFTLEIKIPDRYPFEPPKMRFLTPIYHPNIDNAGRICLDILKLPPKGAWRPSLNISTVLIHRMLSRKLGQELGRPTQSLSGWLISKFLKKHNQILEENAVKLCEIQPDDTVLELGHGPGLGLQVAVQLLTGPGGKLLGVDYSKYMHRMASERMQEHIASGKVTLHCCDVAAMPLEDSSVDKVFHCNCYYFWPDLKAVTSEIHRAMKPGALMVTTLRLDRVVTLASKKVFPGENWRPEAYIEALQSCGFADIRMENRTEKLIPFQAIYATAAK